MDEKDLAAKKPSELRAWIARPNRKRARKILAKKTYRETHSGPLLIVGSAPNAWLELRRMISQYPDAKIMLIGHAAGLFIGDFIVSDHYESHPKLRKLQDDLCESNDVEPRYTTHCTRPSSFWRWPEIDYFWNFQRSVGSSLETALRIAIFLEFVPIVICGCPLRKAPIQHPDQIAKDGEIWPPPRNLKKFYPKEGWNTTDEILDRFREGLTIFKHKNRDQIANVRAVSGYPRKLFGAPEKG